MIERLITEERLPDSYREIVERCWRPLAKAIAGRHAGKTLVVGINGAQGSGKSTLCRFLAEALLPALGLRAAVLALDDLYRTKAERAAAVYPLLAVRGVPGTHDTDLGLAQIDALQRPGAVELVRFDKSIDDRRGHHPAVEAPVDVILFEGWCVGATPMGDAAVTPPINALEAEEDRDGQWRQAVETALAGPYARLFARIDMLVMLRPPDFAAVLDNRLLQERKLRAASPGAPGVMTDAEVERFVMHYERLTRHMLLTMPGRADFIFDIGNDRGVTGPSLSQDQRGGVPSTSSSISGNGTIPAA